VEHLYVTTLMKAHIADYHRFINEEAVKLDRHRKRKGEPRRHSV